MMRLALLLLLVCAATSAAPLHPAAAPAPAPAAAAVGLERNLFVKRAPAPCPRRPCRATLEYEFDLIDLGPDYRGARF